MEKDDQGKSLERFNGINTTVKDNSIQASSDQHLLPQAQSESYLEHRFDQNSKFLMNETDIVIDELIDPIQENHEISNKGSTASLSNCTEEVSKRETLQPNSHTLVSCFLSFSSLKKLKSIMNIVMWYVDI